MSFNIDNIDIMNKKLIVIGAPYNDNSNDHSFINDIIESLVTDEQIASIKIPQINVRNSSETIINVVKMLFKNDPSQKVMTLSDNNTVSYWQITQWLNLKKEQDKRFAIIHFDNHANLHKLDPQIGLNNKNWASLLIPELNKPSDFIQIGINFDLQPDGAPYEVNQFSSKSVYENIGLVTKNVTDYLRVEGIDEVYLSLDMSVMDADYIGPTPKSTSRGLEPHHVNYIVSAITQEFKISAADISEVHLMPHYKNNFLLNPQPQTTRINTYLIGQALREAIFKWQ